MKELVDKYKQTERRYEVEWLGNYANTFELAECFDPEDLEEFFVGELQLSKANADKWKQLAMSLKFQVQQLKAELADEDFSPTARKSKPKARPKVSHIVLIGLLFPSQVKRFLMQVSMPDVPVDSTDAVDDVAQEQTEPQPHPMDTNAVIFYCFFLYFSLNSNDVV